MYASLGSYVGIDRNGIVQMKLPDASTYGPADEFYDRRSHYTSDTYENQ